MVLDINVNIEDGFCDWVEGEGVLAELLPLYRQIKLGNYHLLKILASSYDAETGIQPIDESNMILSEAELAFFQAAELLGCDVTS